MANRTDVIKAIEKYFLLNHVEEQCSLKQIGLKSEYNARNFSDFLNREFEFKTNVKQILKASCVKELLDDLDLEKEESPKRNNEISEELYEYLLKIEVIEKELTSLLEETKSVSEGFADLGNHIRSYSKNIGKAGAEFSKSFGQGLKDMAKLTGNKKHTMIGEFADSGAEIVGQIIGSVVDVVGNTVEFAGSLWRKYKENRIKRKVLNKKQEIAYLKIETVEKQYEKICSYVEKIGELYAKGDVIVSLDDKMLENKICIFRSTFYLYIKTIYLKKVLEYVLAEYSAWIEGEQNSDESKPFINSIVTEFASAYLDNPQNNNGSSRKELLIDLCQLNISQKSSLGRLLFFADPYLFRTYINCKIGSSNYSSGFIKLWADNRYSKLDKKNGLLSTQIGSGIERILALNNYYNDCKIVVLLEKNKLPRYPCYNMFDIALDISFLYGMYYFGSLCWLNYSGWTFTGLLILLLLSMVVVQILIRSSCIPFTYSKRKDKYESIVCQLSDELKKIEKKYAFGVTQ